MRWFKHFSKAHRDTKIKRLINDFGADGYAVYFYCIELIAEDVESENLSFELEDDAELVGQYLKIDTLRVEKIMKKCVDLDLFGMTYDGVITCIKMAKFLDERYTRNQELKNMINSERMQDVKKCLKTNGDISRQKRLEENRTEEKRKEKKEQKPCFKFSVSPLVKLSLSDYRKLRTDYPSKQDLRWAIERLDAYIDSSDKGKKYTDHRAVLRKGNWVYKEWTKEKLNADSHGKRNIVKHGEKIDKEAFYNAYK